jgi:RNA polymerase sigma factor (sigma-70 family)
LPPNTTIDNPPCVGPYGDREWDAAAGKWRVRLTAAGRDVVADYLNRHPDPLTLVSFGRRRLYDAMRRRGDPQDEGGDARAEATEAVVRAVIAFRPDGGAKLSTWLYRVVPQRVSHWHRRRELRRVPAAALNDGLDAAGGPCHAAASADRDAVVHLLRRLHPRHARVVRLYHGVGTGRGPLTLAEVGAELGVSKSRVQQVYAAALAELRAHAGVTA